MEKILSQLKNVLPDVKHDNLKQKLNKIIKQFDEYDQKEVVINAGLLKAGKSSLFNAILGDSIFLVDAVRATIDSEEYNAGDYLFIDTPGLDANDTDSQIAYDTYKYADIIVYSHNVNDGELTRTELDEIEKISDIFGGAKNLFTSMILVLTHSDQKENDELIIIKNKILEQLENKFSILPSYTFTVDSKAYLQGLEQNNDVLKQSGNIEQVKLTIKDLFKQQIDNNNSLFRQYINQQIFQLIHYDDNLIDKNKKEIMNLEKTYSNIDYKKAKNTVSKKLLNLKSKLEETTDIKKIDVRSIEVFKPYCYQEYKSAFEAEKAGKSELKTVINESVKQCRLWGGIYTSNYISLTDKEFNYHLFNLIDGEIVKINEMLYRENFIDKSIDSKIHLLEMNKIDDLTDKIKFDSTYINAISKETFGSVDYYCNRYSCNFDVDYDYREELVETLFGYKYKEIKKYKWDADGAYDDIISDAKDILTRRAEIFYDRYRELMSIYLIHYKKEIDNYNQKVIDYLNKQIIKQNENNQNVTIKIEKLNLEIASVERIANLVNKGV